MGVPVGERSVFALGRFSVDCSALSFATAKLWITGIVVLVFYRCTVVFDDWRLYAQKSL